MEERDCQQQQQNFENLIAQLGQAEDKEIEKISGCAKLFV